MTKMEYVDIHSRGSRKSISASNKKHFADLLPCQSLTCFVGYSRMCPEDYDVDITCKGDVASAKRASADTKVRFCEFQQCLTPEWLAQVEEDQPGSMPQNFLDSLKQQPNTIIDLRPAQTRLLRQRALTHGWLNQFTHIHRTEEKEANFVYQCRSRKSHDWVDVTYQWLVDNLKYNKKGFYKDLTDPDQPSNQILELPVGKACAHSSISFLKSAPPIKYQQGNDPTCCFSSLASALDAIGDVVAASVISSAITSSTKVTGVDAASQVHAYKSRIDYARCLMANQVKIPGVRNAHIKVCPTNLVSLMTFSMTSPSFLHLFS